MYIQTERSKLLAELTDRVFDCLQQIRPKYGVVWVVRFGPRGVARSPDNRHDESLVQEGERNVSGDQEDVILL